jgi:hypothetical protein
MDSPTGPASATNRPQNHLLRSNRQRPSAGSTTKSKGSEIRLSLAATAAYI